MKKYIEKYFWDFVLCVLISIGLSLNVFAGYDMTDPLADNLLAVAGVVIVVMIVLFLAYYDRRVLGISIIAEALALIAAIVILQQTGVFSNSKSIDGNPLLFWIIVISTSLVVFWAGRTRAGLVSLFLAGTIMTAAFDLLEYPVCQWGYFVFIFGVFVLFLYRVYCISLRDSDKGKTAFSEYFAQSVIVGMMALVLASGVYYGVIKPMSPPTDRLKLATRLMSMDILKKIGVSSVTVIPSNETIMNNQNQEKTNEGGYHHNKKNNQQKKEGKIVHGQNPIKNKAVTFKFNSYIVWIVAASLLIILILAVFIKILLRKKWYNDLLKESNEDCAMGLYSYFINKIGKTGFNRSDGLTLLEYADDMQNELGDFAVGDANFLKLTQIYTRILYGCQRISEDEWELFNDFYKEFNRNLKNKMGSFRYLLHFFSI